jgi:hypothetical protein
MIMVVLMMMVVVPMLVVMIMLVVMVLMGVGVRVSVRVSVRRPGGRCVGVLVVMFQMDVKFHAADGRFLPARDVQVIPVQPELGELGFEPARVHAQVEQGGDKHVASEAAYQIQVENGRFFGHRSCGS